MSARELRRIIVIVLLVVGLILTLTSVAAEPLGLGNTPAFGVLQMAAFLGGITLITLAIYLQLYSRRPAGSPRSLQADIGIRLSATGVVLAYVSGFADLFTIGTHVQPAFNRPFVGPLQATGLVFGLVAIVAGIFLYYTSRGERSRSSLSFLIRSRRPE